MFAVLVFVGEVKGDKAQGIPCLTLESLLSYLREQKNVLSYEQAKKSFEVLDALTR